MHLLAVVRDRGGFPWCDSSRRWAGGKPGSMHRGRARGRGQRAGRIRPSTSTSPCSVVYGRGIAEDAAGLVDRVVEVQAEELVAGLVDQGGSVDFEPLGPPLQQDRPGSRPARAGSAGAGGRGPPARPPGRRTAACVTRPAVGQVEDLADGLGDLGREEDAVDEVLDVDAVERLLARAEVGEPAAPQGVEQLGQDGPVALAVDEAGADDRRAAGPVPRRSARRAPRPRSWSGCRRRASRPPGGSSRRSRGGRGPRRRPAS